MAEAPELALVADIGGTNARFALADIGVAQARLREERTYRTADFPGLEDALAAFITDAGLAAPPAGAALAVASPVRGDRVDLTNRAWSFCRSNLTDRFSFRTLKVLNDFAAIAYALPHLKQNDLFHVCGPQREGAGAVLAVVGPGTGLGVGCLVRAGRAWRVIASEGGHESFAPADAFEIELLRILQQRFGHVSYERVLSGPGLVNLYTVLAEVEGLPADDRGPADIVRQGTAGTDRLSAAALAQYCAILGGFAGNMALTFGADSVFIGGGIVPRFSDYLLRSEFQARFEAKGRFAALLRSVPVDVIMHRMPGLLGAAMALEAELHKGM